MGRWLDRCVSWALDTLGHATAHPVFWLLVLGYAFGITIALVIVVTGQPDINYITRDYHITLPERP